MSIVTHKPVLLPKNADMSKWAVIACDQYTTDRSYWEDVEKHVGEEPSTFRLVFPEIFLKDDDVEDRILSVNSHMQDYLTQGVFIEKDCYVLTERTVADGRKRIGLVACVDLEEYDYKKPNARIRPTEETIEERLPIRIHIRQNAPLELPHILLLTDDANKSVIFPLYAQKNEFNVLYDFDLYPNGGHIRGYEVPPEKFNAEKFDALLSPIVQEKKYGHDAEILFAVGDGNHSMAAAKRHWENLKSTLSERERKSHPARFALVEILNIYDEALDFLPINRNVFCDDPEDLVARLETTLARTDADEKSFITVITRQGKRRLVCSQNAAETIITIQNFLEEEKKKGVNIEYVHEDKKVEEDGQKPGCVGILMPVFPKKELFPYVVAHGKLPKKAFSMGEEKNKKYYIEAKRIK